MSKTMGTCDDCFFWERLTHSNGECRRRAPHHDFYNPDTEKRVAESRFPHTPSSYWCGEYEENTGPR